MGLIVITALSSWREIESEDVESVNDESGIGEYPFILAYLITTISSGSSGGVSGLMK